MIASWPVLLDVALRTTIVYFALLLGIRLTGKRQLGQMHPFDLVLLLIIANAVQNAMVGPDTSVAGGLVAAGVLLTWHMGIDRLRRANRHVARWLEGEGILLITQGAMLPGQLQRAGITAADLYQALREHGVAAVTDVRLAVLEPDGTISVIRNDDLTPGNRPHRRIKTLRR